MKAFRHPATIIASLALFVSLGSGAALASGLISGRQIKNHTVAENKLTKSAVQALRGHRGLQGLQGEKGDTGAPGPSSATSAYAVDSVSLNSSGMTTVVSLTLPAGSYVVLSNMTIADLSGQDTICLLVDSHAGELDRNQAFTAGPTQSASLEGPLTTAGSTVSVQCQGGDNSAVVDNTHLIAIKVGSVNGS